MFDRIPLGNSEDVFNQALLAFFDDDMRCNFCNQIKSHNAIYNQDDEDRIMALVTDSGRSVCWKRQGYEMEDVE